VAGYGRRATDEWLMRGTDVTLAFPQMVCVLLFVSLIGRDPWMLVIGTTVAQQCSHPPGDDLPCCWG